MFNGYSKEGEALAIEHAIEAFPHESVGVLTTSGYIRLENMHDEPHKAFYTGGDEFAFMMSRGEIIAFYHSHPKEPEKRVKAFPSKVDMSEQISMHLPWGIIVIGDRGVYDHTFYFGDQVPTPDLVGRPFRHGVTDCYALIRDWWKLEKNVCIREFPRQWMWWKEEGENMYEKFFPDAGFKRLPSCAEPRPGDVFFAKLQSNVINHGGVYIGNGLIMHHRTSGYGYDPTTLSQREGVARWREMIEYWVRYENT